MEITGILVVIAAGLVQGMWTAPLRLVSPGWRFEQSWIFVSLTLIFLPVIIGAITLHDIPAILASEPAGHRVGTCLLGMAWGVGMVLFGLCAVVVGHGLAFSLILGLSASLGSLLPLFIFERDEVTEKAGIFDMVGVAIAIVGIAMTGYSGVRRERLEKEHNENEKKHAFLMDQESSKMGVKCDKEKTVSVQEDVGSPRHGHGEKLFPFSVGVFLCVVAGMLSCCFAISVVYAAPFAEEAIALGASTSMSGNIIWILVFSCGGGLVNLLYSIVLLLKHGTWRGLICPKGSKCVFFRNILLNISQGLLFWGGNEIYGVGLSMLGDFGPVFGFPIVMAMNIVTANVFGAVVGEWSHGDRLATAVGVLGNVVILVSVGVVGAGAS